MLACVALAVALLAAPAQAAPGDLDPGFGAGGKVVTDLGSSSFELVQAVALQPNGKIVAAGFGNAAGSFDFALARYDAAGSVDASFGSGGKVLTDFGTSTFDQVFAVVLQPNGKIVAAGSSSGGASAEFALARYNADGSLDSSFGSGGKVLTDLGSSAADAAQAVALQPNGKIVAAGHSNAGGSLDFALVRYNADGSPDASFGSGGKVLTDLGSSATDAAQAVALQPDGKIVAAGHSDAGGGLDFALVRYNADGSLDSSFGSGGKVLTDLGSSSSYEFVSGVSLQPNGKIVAAGYSNAVDSSGDFALARYNADGSLDSSFGSGGKVLTDFGSASADGPARVALQPNGKIVAAGFSNAADSSGDFALARYNADGSLDSSFGSGGKVLTDLGSSSADAPYAVGLQPNGQIVAAGYSNAGGTFDFALVRYSGR